MACCLQGGYISTEKLTLLRRLGETGIELPEGAQIWGPGDGLAWRLVDHRGRPPAAGPVGGRASIRATAGADRLEVSEDRAGRRMVHPAAG